MNGSTPYEGRLEIRRNGGPWGTAYGVMWSSREASVACRSLGFSSSVLSPDTTTKAFGRGTGPVHLVGGWCTGEEISLLDCRSIKWGNLPEDIPDTHCCDIGLYCMPGKFKSM